MYLFFLILLHLFSLLLINFDILNNEIQYYNQYKIYPQFLQNLKILKSTWISRFSFFFIIFSSFLLFEVIKLNIICKPPFFRIESPKLKSIPLPDISVEIITVFRSIFLETKFISLSFPIILINLIFGKFILIISCLILLLN